MRGTSLEDRFFHIARHALVSLEDLCYDLTFAVAGHLQALDLACWSDKVACVVAVALSSPGGGELSVAGVEVLGHLLLEHLLKNGLHTLAYSGLDIHLDVMLKLVFLGGQAPPFSLETHNLPDAILRELSVR